MNNNLNVKIVPMSRDARIPHQAQGATTYNLYASQGVMVRAKTNAIVPTDVRVQIPKGMYGNVITPP